MVDIGAVGRLPRRPGVYIMKGAGGEVLYVGKAVDIRRRVSSYFTPRGDGRTAIPAMVSRAGGVDFIVTDTEKEALLLEETLIREHRPRYNVSLKEAGSCAHIRIAEGEEYPRIEITRRFRRDGARWFGPYSSVDAARRTVRFLQRIFPLRDCASPAPPRRSRPCLSHQIGRCPAPCRGLIGRAEYAALVRRACLFLSGRDGGLLRELEGEMRREAAALRFEKAREIRETIAAIRKTIEGQKTVSLDGADRDAIGVHREGGRGAAALLFVRGGRLIGARTIPFEGDDASLLGELIRRHYLGGRVPPEILLRRAADAGGSAERWWTRGAGRCAFASRAGGAPGLHGGVERGGGVRRVRNAPARRETGLELAKRFRLPLAPAISSASTYRTSAAPPAPARWSRSGTGSRGRALPAIHDEGRGGDDCG